jgi:hypothetical protein
MCSLYVFGRILGMSSLTHILVSINIRVMCAVRLSIERAILWDINVHMVVSIHIAVMCAARLSIERVTL